MIRILGVLFFAFVAVTAFTLAFMAVTVFAY